MAEQMDLNRLRIPDAPAPSPNRRWPVAILCLVTAIVGFLFARVTAPAPAPAPANPIGPVPATPRNTGPTHFTAGGWIEAATPTYPLMVTARITERLDRVLVVQGQMVDPGQVVARLYKEDMASRLELAEAKYLAADKELRKLEAGFRKEDIALAKAELEEAAERMRLAAAIVERTKTLPQGALSAEEIDRERAELQEARSRHAQAKAKADKMTAGYRQEDVAFARARRLQSKATHALAKRNLDYCTLRAPEAGRRLRVLQVYHTTGEWVNANKEPAVISLYDPKDLHVRVDVTQAKIKSVHVGQTTRILTEADPSRKYKGEVLRIEPLAQIAKNTITVRIRILDPDEYLFPDMVAQVAFEPAKAASPEPNDIASERLPEKEGK